MINWIKTNKFITIVIILAAFFLLQVSKTFFGVNLLSLNIPSSRSNYPTADSYVSTPSAGGSTFGSAGMGAASSLSYNSKSSYAPQAEVGNRLVIQESNLSLLVKNVVEVKNKILDFANSNGGYMVSTSTSNPQDAPTSTVIIRVKSDKLQAALDYFHSLSIKVVSENLYGKDVTDQFVDIDKRISQLERTQTKFEEILERATQISEITNLTTQITSYQNQIDQLKGQQDSLQKNSELAKLTIYLSTDEIALPYAPNDTFRPLVTFKLAVRSLVRSLRGLANMAIWIAVFSVIWIPTLLIIKYFKNWQKNKKPTSLN